MAQLLQSKTGYLKGCHGAVIIPLNADGSDPGTLVRHGITTPQSIGVELDITEGEESELRGGDVILVKVKEQDVFTSGTLSLVDARFDAKALEYLAGGTIIEVVEGSDTRVTGWSAPKLADQYARIPCRIEVYVRNYDATGSIDGYIKYTFYHCVGMAPNAEHEDEEWAAPELEIYMKENPEQATKGLYDKEFVDSLPAEIPAA